MSMMKKRANQNGFTLIELLMVVLLLSIVVGAVFSQIERAQVRYKVEDQRTDLTQQEREFIDQFTRDLHQTGYPSVNMLPGCGGQQRGRRTAFAFGERRDYGRRCRW